MTERHENEKRKEELIIENIRKSHARFDEAVERDKKTKKRNNLLRMSQSRNMDSSTLSEKSDEEHTVEDEPPTREDEYEAQIGSELLQQTQFMQRRTERSAGFVNVLGYMIPREYARKALLWVTIFGGAVAVIMISRLYSKYSSGGAPISGGEEDSAIEL